MKKFTLILLITIYSISTFGVSLKKFYCCGKLKSVSVIIAVNGIDKCNRGDRKDGCCKTKYQYFKVKDSHLATADLATPEKNFTDLHTFTLSLQSVASITQGVHTINGSHAPPLHAGVPIFILNCVFII